MGEGQVVFTIEPPSMTAWTYELDPIYTIR